MSGFWNVCGMLAGKQLVVSHLLHARLNMEHKSELGCSDFRWSEICSWFTNFRDLCLPLLLLPPVALFYIRTSYFL